MLKHDYAVSPSNLTLIISWRLACSATWMHGALDAVLLMFLNLRHADKGHEVDNSIDNMATDATVSTGLRPTNLHSEPAGSFSRCCCCFHLVLVGSFQ